MRKGITWKKTKKKNNNKGKGPANKSGAQVTDEKDTAWGKVQSKGLAAELGENKKISKKKKKKKSR